MISVIYAHTSFLGDINTLTVDLLCLAESINEMKKQNTEQWEAIVEEFKEIANKSKDKYEYRVVKEFITNLQDLY